MITFTYKLDKKNHKTGLIWWEVAWDGKHDEKWYNADAHTPHPFFRTCEFESGYTLWKSYDDAMKHQRKTRVTPYKKMSPAMESLLGDSRLTRKEIAELHPNTLRTYDCVCALNPVTLAMCKMLEHPEKITKHSGMSDPYWYWGGILGCLSRLWD